jgi:hypothetical protein
LFFAIDVLRNYLPVDGVEIITNGDVPDAEAD